MSDAALAEIDHFVVLMLENRSFDHMLGWLRPAGDGFRGLTGDEWNPIDAADFAVDDLPPDRRAHVARGVAASHTPNPVPGEQFFDVNTQLFGRRTPPPGARPTNRGFVINYGSAIDRYNTYHPWNLRDTDARSILECHRPEQLPVLSRLASEFAVCDAWHASTPSATFGNRFFLHAATSNGQVENLPPRPFPRETIFNRLTRAGLPWRVYFHDFPSALLCAQTWEHPTHFHLFERFLVDAAAGTLPAYSFVEPRYFMQGTAFANDQHPPHDVRYGEALIAQVYNALRAGPRWPKTLLLVVWDEHGGTFDHVAPPAATPPDGAIAGDHGFGFDRFGVRVPAVLVSPWIAPGTVFRPPAGGPPCDHTSVAATLARRFGLDGPLTARDAAAPTLAGALALSGARGDAVARVEPPAPPPLGDELAAYVDLTPLQTAIVEAVKLLPRAPGAVAQSVAGARGELSQSVDAAVATVKDRIRGFLAHLFS